MPERKFQPKLLSQRGQTLLELILALSLSALILTLLSTLSLAVAAHAKRASDFFLLEQHLSLGIELLEKELHLAGFIGCAQRASGALSIGLEEDGSNSITLRHRSQSSAFLLLASSPKELVLSSTLTLYEGALLLLTDCHSIEIVQVKSFGPSFMTGQQVELTQALAFSYPKGTQVGFYEMNKFYIADSGRRDQAGTKIYALYRHDQQGHSSELIEDLHSLKISREEQGGLSLRLQAKRGEQQLSEYAFFGLRRGYEN